MQQNGDQILLRGKVTSPISFQPSRQSRDFGEQDIRQNPASKKPTGKPGTKGIDKPGTNGTKTPVSKRSEKPGTKGTDKSGTKGTEEPGTIGTEKSGTEKVKKTIQRHKA